MFVLFKFVSRYIPTIGVDYGVKVVRPTTQKNFKENVKINFWDLGGHKEFIDVRNEFYTDTQGVWCQLKLLVCDFLAARWLQFAPEVRRCATQVYNGEGVDTIMNFMVEIWWKSQNKESGHTFVCFVSRWTMGTAWRCVKNTTEHARGYNVPLTEHRERWPDTRVPCPSQEFS